MTDVTIEQIIVGLYPYVLLEITDVDLEGGAPTGVNIDVQVGGGVNREDIKDVLLLALEGLREAGEDV